MNVKFEVPEIPGITVSISEEWLAARQQQQSLIRQGVMGLIHTLSVIYLPDDKQTASLPLVFPDGEQFPNKV